MTAGQLLLRDLVKRYDDAAAVAGLSLDMNGGEFFSLLGPSGCGKTTTLRLVAGFEEPDEGGIVLDGADLCAAATTPAAGARLLRGSPEPIS